MTSNQYGVEMEPHAMEVSLRVLVVDDEARIREVCRQCLSRDGHDVKTVASSDEALEAVALEYFQVVFLDVRLQGKSGLDLIEPMLEQNSSLKIIVITAHASISSAVEAIKRGASDYLPKPFTAEQIRLALKKAVDIQQLENRVDLLEGDLQRSHPDELLSSESPSMRAVLEEARLVAESDASVLLRGESGTGKGVLARAIHRWSGRAHEPFAVVHAPSLNRELLESELFGHVQGAFTGATKSSPGRISQAEGGTLFLDEIADLPIELQPKLLRFVQSRQYERVGDPESMRADVRLITATNQDLEQAVADGRFREDLLYRLNVIELELPPLRERRGDIFPLAERFLSHFATKYNKMAVRLGEGAQDLLSSHSWPGNIRELKNAIERAVIICQNEEVESIHLPFSGRNPHHIPHTGGHFSLEEIEEAHIRQVLKNTQTLAEAARILDIDTTTLWRRRKKLGLENQSDAAT